MSKEVAGGLLLVTGNGRSKQLRGIGVVPFLEIAVIKSNVVHYVSEPTRVERPCFEVAYDLGFYLSDYDTSFFSQI